MWYKIIFLLLCSSAIIGCNQIEQERKTVSQKLPSKFDEGKIYDNRYIQKYFGLTIPFGNGWQVLSEEQIEFAELQHKELLIKPDNNTGYYYDDEEDESNTPNIQKTTLLVLFKYPIDSAVTYNPFFTANVHRIQKYDNMDTATQYLSQIEESLYYDYSAERTNYGEGYKSYVIGKNNAPMLGTTLEINGVEVQQEYFAIIKRNFVISFVISYQTAAEKAELRAIIDKINL